MLSKAVFVTLVAQEGKQAEVEDFLRSAKDIVENEPGTRTWYAVKISSTDHGIFDTFDDERVTQTHLHDEVAKALAAQAPELFSEDPIINSYDTLAET